MKEHEQESHLDKLESLALAATEGPWVTVPVSRRVNCSGGKPPAFKNGRWAILPGHDTHRMPLAEVDHADDHCTAAREHAENDARFIAAANPAAILALVERAREAEAERKRFENLFASTCETLGRVKRELGMPDAAIGTEPEQAAALRQERDALAAQALLLESIKEQYHSGLLNGAFLAGELLEKMEEAPISSLARLKAQWQAEGAEVVRDRLREKANVSRVAGKQANSAFYHRCANVANHKADDIRRQAEEADQ